MSFNPGRNVGRLSIRVVPDTKQFRKELTKQLETVARTTRMAVTVDKARLDRAKIREDIRRQMEDLKGLDAAVNVKVTIDKARLKKASLRKSIQEQFDRFDDIRVNIAAHIGNVELFEKQVRDMVQRASRNEVKIRAAAHTLDASAQMAWLSRDRFVNLIVRVSQKSVASALTTLAALSGARLSWDWIDSLLQKVARLDQALPSIVNWTTGLTSLVASIFAATSGLVGIGAGLVSILPAFLVLPGLLVNSLGSLTAFVVALRNAKTELAPLAEDMRELGDIINETFWERARQPILDLVTGLMPQLRAAFQNVSVGIGDFTAALANAFGSELAGGRLLSIFDGIAQGWQILATGAPAFAGAMTSLSEIAAKYTPRLATWFVRQADTFDKFLTSIATDGRLESWMESAIDSMYDLWDATTGLAGVFEGLWTAAEAGGSGGLAGFADMMLDWERTVKGADFQRGLTAIFRGSSVAMEAFGNAVSAIGRLVLGLDTSIEKFIGTAGKFLGGLIESVADALNTPLVAAGLNDFSDGLLKALEGIKPSLQPIADTFGNFLGLLGDLTETLLPTATTVLADLMPSIDSLISTIRDSGVLEHLGTAITKISDALGPAIEDLVTALGPIVMDTFKALADALVDISPVIVSLIDALTAFVESIPDLSEVFGRSLPSEDALKKLTDVLGVKPKDDGNPFTTEVPVKLNVWWAEDASKETARDIATFFMLEYERVLEEKGQGAADKLVDGFRKIKGLPPEVIEAINRQLETGIALPKLDNWQKKGLDAVVDGVADAFKSGGQSKAEEIWKSYLNPPAGFKPLDPSIRAWAVEQLTDLGIELEATAAGGGGGMARGLTRGFASGAGDLETAARGMKDAVGRGLDGSGEWLKPQGAATASGLKTGMSDFLPNITAWLTGLNVPLNDALVGAPTWLTGPGGQLIDGMKSGAEVQKPTLLGVFMGLQGEIIASIGDVGGWLWQTGQDIVGGLVQGIRDAASWVSDAINSIVGGSGRRRGEALGSSIGAGQEIGARVAAGISRESAAIERAMSAVDLSGTSVSAGGMSAVPVLHQTNHFEHADPEVAVRLAREAGQFELRQG